MGCRRSCMGGEGQVTHRRIDPPVSDSELVKLSAEMEAVSQYSDTPLINCICGALAEYGRDAKPGLCGPVPRWLYANKTALASRDAYRHIRTANVSASNSFLCSDNVAVKIYDVPFLIKCGDS